MSTGFNPRYFNPAGERGARIEKKSGNVTLRLSDELVYVYSPEVVLAVNAALATQRPLLVAGSPGTGKSSLAANVAGVLGRKYYERVVNSRTRARDLMWRFDQLRRLAMAGAGEELPPRAAHVEPQVLWWAFDAASARWRGAKGAQRKQVNEATDLVRSGSGNTSVLLIDEIDKAEPDVPNDLLEALDQECFTVEDLDEEVVVRGQRSKVLMLITTNRERELPAAFVRRCVVLDLDKPQAEWEAWLVEVANQHFGIGQQALHQQVAQAVMLFRQQGGGRKPGTAEYLDAVRACRQLRLRPSSPRWPQLARALLTKQAAATPMDADV